ncbi:MULTISPECIES: hypothetical protein [unclassified Variovorax]|uniref:hypothetical protein n=1 Tax=unclassified Variovorax TaxID=663243 RepID=UPI0008387D2B|nr:MULTISPECIES: hypothetical protein [unclassified Variovorax]PNG50280.1 hypothetical protein CHC06_05903 [Variovorax sp. B2]PNG51153.1 hypothetical protein CHC07_05809 [Variovorax sp. B4]VTV17363.1 hypothetical protein WDL1P1_00327 [Variovorax sp. WDL1]
MDIAQFEARARNPSLTREELESLKANALAKGNKEFAAIAAEVLDERFPMAKHKSAGATPTTATINGRVEQSVSGKDAYIWLVERLRDHRPGLLSVYLQRKSHYFKRGGRAYFAKSVEALFPQGSALAATPGTWVELQEGWFANVNLNHAQKFAILLRLAAIAGLRYPDDWDFKVTGATESLSEKQASAALSEALLHELGEP